ncbi:MAG: glycosyltransferase family 4 protein [Betaproteobacteria bacterium]|jgi:glycosyltransferase involved in cell wall biosynthesis
MPPTLYTRLRHWWGRLQGSAPAAATVTPRLQGLGGGGQDATVLEATTPNTANPTPAVPYDEALLERARTQWQFGDWPTLAALTRDTLQHHPERAKLALLAAAGHQQMGDTAAARQFTRLAQDWGCSKKLVAQVLIAGAHNTLARVAAAAGQVPRALKHFHDSIAIGTPNTDLALATQARVGHEWQSLTQYVRLPAGMPDPVEIQSQVVNRSRSLGNLPFVSEFQKFSMPSPTGLLSGKRILIICWFQNLSGGGLHEYVRDSMRAVRSAGGEAVLVCPKSRFSDEIESEHYQVIPTDFEDPELVRHIAKRGPFDIIHAHPGKSKSLAFELKKILNIPLIYTIHGRWDDNVSDSMVLVDRIVCVSNHIAEIFYSHNVVHKSQISIIPNGLDIELFDLESQINLSHREEFIGIYSGRVDPDKKSAIDIMKNLWRMQSEGLLTGFRWIVAGDGSLLHELKAESVDLFGSGSNSVEFLGWLSRSELASALRRSAIAIAAGRSALEALGAGLPVVASGREGSFLIDDWSTLLKAEWANFGGFGSQGFDEPIDLIVEKIGRIIRDFDSKKNLDFSVALSRYIKSRRSIAFTSEQLVLQYSGLIHQRVTH